MLPPNSITERGRYLQAKFDAVEGHVALSEWPRLSEKDQFHIGRIVMLYSFVELNLRRMVEAWEDAGLLTVPMKCKAKDLRIGALEETVQRMFPWPDNELNALKRLAEMRTLRNLVAHFGAIRFPDEDAFVFIAKSESDFKRQFPGKTAQPGILMTAILDGPVLAGVMDEVQHISEWLAKQTAIMVRQAYERTKAPTP
ncbi:hypothetical protein [Bradyrhizobium sp. LeoA1S1]